MALQIPKTKSLYSLRGEWRHTRRFSPHGFKLRLEVQRGVQHWQGGPPVHRGTQCSRCKQPLILVWDLALTDRQFPKFLAEVFRPVKRLPFYFCTKCGACSYRLSSENTIQCFAPDIDGDSPFEEVATPLERRRISFERIPSQIDGILTLGDTIGFRNLDEAAQNTLLNTIDSGSQRPATFPSVSLEGSRFLAKATTSSFVQIASVPQAS